MSSHHGHDHDDELGPPRLQEVADGVFAYVQPDGTWWINNTGVLIGDDGVTAIDTCSTERRTRAFLETVGTITSAPLRVLVNTHHHGDHTHGNHLTHPATIVGHRRCRDAMLAAGVHTDMLDAVFGARDWGDIELTPPMLTFEDRIDLHVGDLRAEVHHIGTPAHTDNDVVVHLPEQRVLFAGDLAFNGGTPFVLMGSVTGALDAVQRIRRFEADVVVPGHGEVCDMAVFDRLERYYRFVQRTAVEARGAGLTPLEAARDLDLGEFAELTDAERIVGNLHRAMFELDGAEPGAPIDVAGAILDMVAFNGGKPLRCLA